MSGQILTIKIEIIQDDTHDAVKQIIQKVQQAYSYATFELVGWSVERKPRP